MPLKSILIFLLIGLFSCQDLPQKGYGFYYWRSDYSLNETEKKHLDRSTCLDFFIRGGDVDKVNGKIQFISKIQNLVPLSLGKKIVPVFFITNRTWLNDSSNDLKLAAQLIVNEVAKIEKNTQQKCSEIQIDCDWTAGTRMEYFRFIKTLGQISNKKISCTIRLHQVKDKEKTGIPPVEKGYLMCYATTSPLEEGANNSILDFMILKNYLTELEEYPLKMDYALPIYSWGIITNHLGKKRLINAVSEADLQNQNFQKTEKGTYIITRDGFYFGMYLSKGFIIKVESVPEDDIVKVKKYIESKVDYPFNYIYYHLDSRFTERYLGFF